MGESIKLGPRGEAGRTAPKPSPAGQPGGLNSTLEMRHFVAIGGAVLTLALTFGLGFVVGQNTTRSTTAVAGMADPEAVQNQARTAPETPGPVGGGGGDPEAVSRNQARPGADD